MATNNIMLQKKIHDSGLSITFIANKTGITRQTLYNRFDGIGEWNASEIVAMTNVLRLTRAERDSIFLS